MIVRSTPATSNETVTKSVLVTGLSFGVHHARILETSEPDWSTRNLFTQVDHLGASNLPVSHVASSVTSSSVIPSRLVAATSARGLDHHSHARHLSAGLFPRLAQPREALGAECSTINCSDAGLIGNCCVGESLVLAFWERGSAPWTAQRSVNLRTNDWTDGATPAFVTAYKEARPQGAVQVLPWASSVFLAFGPL